MSVKQNQQFEISGRKYRVAAIRGKEARLVEVGAKKEDISESDGSLKYRRLTTLERMLDARSQKPAASEEPAEEPQVDSESGERQPQPAAEVR